MTPLPPGARRFNEVRRRAAVWAFPLATIMAAALLTALSLSGSSIALDGPDWRSDHSLLWGTPRAIRSDEYSLSTPNMIGNDRRGLPVQPWVGLTPTYLPATGQGIVAAHWTQVFQPVNWALFVASSSRALAWRWWALLVTGLLGMYALLYTLTRRIALSVGLSMVVAFAPTAAWWSQTPSVVVGLGAAAAACLVRGSRCRRWWTAALFGLAVAYFGFSLFLVLYPPWQVSIGLVALAVAVGTLLDHRENWRAMLITAATGVVALVPCVVFWYSKAREGVLATTNTGYPGHRLSSAGGGNWAWLLDAPTSLWISAAKPAVLKPTDITATGEVVNYANASEISSNWIPLPLLGVAAVVLLLLAMRRRRAGAELSAPAADGRLLWTATLTVAVTALLVAWAVLPLPDFVGNLTLLSRVTGRRTPPAIGMATVLLLALVATGMRRERLPRWLFVVLGIGVVGTIWSMVWAAGALHWVLGRAPDLLGVAAVAAVLALGTAVLLTGRWAGAAALLLGLGACAVYLPVNPVYRGLGPLQKDPLVQALLPYGKAPHVSRAAVYGDPKLLPLVSASGVMNLSGLTLYPDSAVWEQLAPSQKDRWNNYSKYYWVADQSLTQPVIKQIRGTNQQLLINPCAASTLNLHLDLAISSAPLRAPCLVPLLVVPRGKTTAYLYRVITG